jgi:AcrR family transcriptional regulator
MKDRRGPRKAQGKLKAAATEGHRAKNKLLADATDYIMRLDTVDLTLRQIAAAIGTSHRMLVYHFGSKEGLLVEVVRRLEEEQRQRLKKLLDDGVANPLERMRQLWQSLTDPTMWPRERLFFEVYGQALQGRPHTKSLLAEIVEAWLEPLSKFAEQAGVPEKERRLAAQLALAVTRGLLLSLLTTGERDDVDKTMAYFLEHFGPFRDSGVRRAD